MHVRVSRSETTDRVIVACLAGVIIGLLAVGLLSQTVLRHVIPVIPAALAVAAAARSPVWSRYAAFAVFCS